MKIIVETAKPAGFKSAGQRQQRAAGKADFLAGEMARHPG
jgi:hypothetical protein